MAYTRIASSEDREAWLEARRGLVTATDVARLASGGPKTWAAVAAEKNGARGFGGNRYTQWGSEREAVIARQLHTYGLDPNTWVLQKDGTRYAATPDLVGMGIIGEIKTAVWKGEKWSQAPKGYYDQIQWALMVTDSEEAILAVEYHEDFRPKFFDAHLINIVRDEERIGQLVETADRFLQEGPPTGVDRLLGEYAALDERAAELEALASSARAEADEVKELLLKEVDAHHSGEYSSPVARVKVSHPKPASRFDQAGFKKAHPALAKEFTKTSDKTPDPRVSVTFAKEEAA
ncbi:YqaJ viral recombinase family protein [Sediminivirga luteola]|uniref:YqaJ viral recombinase domain-containing protein n=1 Tax=Sediminivirga luteola TaxID=1774748 RepID=A0A8J2XKL8_9MICO|nr:YqaJ viral recombinase family protein [Sediminivirga luteola]GGA11005.1 hypothetical protein GCM10011333_12300 [Sediminivirga luteola]